MRRRLTHTSILAAHLKQLYDPELTSAQDLYLYDHPDVLALKARGQPLYEVFLTRLEPRIQVFADPALKKLRQSSSDLVECVLAGIDLYDTAPFGHLMCIGVGRYPHNMLRPFVGEDMDNYYERPENFDPLAVCAQVSRDHGLVFLDTKGKVFFRDFGTKKLGRRVGSKNGTWVNGVEPIQDLVIPWSNPDYLGIGGRIWVQTPLGLRKEHVFKLRYERRDENGPQ